LFNTNAKGFALYKCKLPFRISQVKYQQDYLRAEKRMKFNRIFPKLSKNLPTENVGKLKS